MIIVCVVEVKGVVISLTVNPYCASSADFAVTLVYEVGESIAVVSNVAVVINAVVSSATVVPTGLIAPIATVASAANPAADRVARL